MLKKHEQSSVSKRRSLFTIEPLEADSTATFSSSMEPHFEGTSSTTDEPQSSNSAAHEAMDIDELETTNRTPMEVPIDDSTCNVGGRPDKRLEINSGETKVYGDEMSTEELGRRADAYLSKFRNFLHMERQESFNRLYTLITRRVKP